MNTRHSRLTIPFVLAGTVVAQASAARPAPMATPIGCAASSRELRLYVINEAGVLPQTLDAAGEEAGRIWATAGLRLTWTLAPAPIDLADSHTVTVVVRRALKRPATVAAVPSKGHAMPLLGQVRFGEDGQPASFIEVSFEAIMGLVMAGSHMDRPVAKLPVFLQGVLLGRGLGRVVAHELGHWLGGRGHVQEGLMKPMFDDRDLVEWDTPRLPRTWTAAAGMLEARFPRCEPTP